MYLLMLGMGNVATKIGDGNVIVGMVGVGVATCVKSY
jgi:hypothetical protein